MARYGYGMSVSGSRTAVVASSGEAPITTSRAFDSSGVQVGDTNTGPIPDSWVDNQSTVTSVIFANDNSVTSIGSYSFRDCSGLTSITIPNSVTDIGGGESFLGCTSLATVTLGTGLASIGNYAFKGCTSLASITVPNNVASIADGAFQDCSSLATVTIGTGVTSIANYVFAACSSLANITIPNSVTSIGTEAFTACGLTSITIPNSVTSIGDDAVSGCANLATKTIGTGVTRIGNYAFQNCGSLATVLCYVAQSAFVGSNAFYYTNSPLTIRARSTDASWTVGTGLTFQGNTNVTVIKNL